MPLFDGEITMANERPVFNAEQKEAWKKAKLLLKSLVPKKDKIRFRALHIAMSEMRGKYKMKQGPIEIESKNPAKAHQRKVEDQYARLRERVEAWKSYLENPGLKKLFVFTDPSLSDSQKAVQSAHAVAQFQKEHPLAPWSNGTLVLLTPDPSLKLYTRDPDVPIMVAFKNYNLNEYNNWNYSTIWREEDLDNAITSIVILDDFQEAGRISGTKML